MSLADLQELALNNAVKAEEENDIESALSAYRSLAELYQQDNQNTKADECLLKAAHYMGTLGRQQQASQLFEDVGSRCSDEQMIECYFKSIICHLCLGNFENSRQLLDTFMNQSESFFNSKQAKLLVSIISTKLDSTIPETVDDNISFWNQPRTKVNVFTDLIREYDHETRLTPWETSLFLIIKRRFL